MDNTVRTAIVVVMGVTGSGKSTIGPLLAQRLGVPYAEADSFHPPSDVAKMAAGQPLDDTDRYPWLAAIGDWIRSRVGSGGVVSCSALKYAYREALRAAYPDLFFLHLDADPELITRRVSARTGHFMRVSLVQSQFAVLEPLRPGEFRVGGRGHAAAGRHRDRRYCRAGHCQRRPELITRPSPRRPHTAGRHR